MRNSCFASSAWIAAVADRSDRGTSMLSHARIAESAGPHRPLVLRSRSAVGSKRRCAFSTTTRRAGTSRVLRAMRTSFGTEIRPNKGVVACLLALSLPPRLSRRCRMSRSARSGAPKIAFGSWAFSFGPFADAPWSFERLCEYAADCGYDGVEINGFRPHPHWEDFRDDADYEALRALRDRLGIEFSGYAPDFTDLPPAEAPTADYLRAIAGAVAFCVALDIPLLRVDTISPPVPLPEAEYELRFGRLVETWRAAAQYCAESSVTLVWEFEPGFWLNRPSEVLRLVTTIDHPNFRILFDSSHAYTGAVAGARQGDDPELLPNGVVEYAELLKPYIGHLHLIDSDGSLHDDETSDHLPFGDGRIDFPSVIAALEPVATALPWWTVDFCFCPTTERDARTAVPFVRSLDMSEVGAHE